jgi:hypothetical protein
MIVTVCIQQGMRQKLLQTEAALREAQAKKDAEAASCAAMAERLQAGEQSCSLVDKSLLTPSRTNRVREAGAGTERDEGCARSLHPRCQNEVCVYYRSLLLWTPWQMLFASISGFFFASLLHCSARFTMRAVIAAANFLWCSIAAESARVLSAAEGQIRALELEAAEAKRDAGEYEKMPYSLIMRLWMRR